MRIIRLLATSLLVALSMVFSSCGSKSQGSNSIVGTWKEYRADGDNDYISSYKFNNDGSGLFIVVGITNTQKISFTWESINNSTIVINFNGEETTLEFNNGLLIENSALGSVVFKKQ